MSKVYKFARNAAKEMRKAKIRQLAETRASAIVDEAYRLADAAEANLDTNLDEWADMCGLDARTLEKINIRERSAQHKEFAADIAYIQSIAQTARTRADLRKFEGPLFGPQSVAYMGHNYPRLCK